MQDAAALNVRPEAQVHPTAIVHEEARLGPGVIVGPWALVGPGVVIGAGTHVGPRVLIEKHTSVGEDCFLANGAVLGTDPQDLKYMGEHSTLVIGDRTIVREFATLNRGTSAHGRTIVGSDCLLMAYTHVAHDCEIGNHVILANSVHMAGHVSIEDWAIVGGVTPIHQFVRIGAHAFVGGGSRVPQDVPPYCRAAGNPPKLYGLNTVGLDRRGLSEDVRKALKRTYRLLFQSDLSLTKALDRVDDEVMGFPEVRHLVAFIRASERGITT
ncbi:MAG: acyl-ACP--UDP-N-acetylglucosamine O-acyltransferase [Gemmatimonadetes bacterium]|nr:acyl-ACP--UDP-N-acetylglucosamine O-acyltransferase [Gemmatimonadota bacterium]MDA1104354.1 acyl-ACP--UDP-N-acetylglucosamine O-acyltransferase [Gemmatimonadota bacterium]